MQKQDSFNTVFSLRANHWSLRDLVAASLLFLASAALVLWQNAHLAVLWDASYTLDTSMRIAMGQMPYRDFPLVHAPLTFLIQAAIIRLFGRVYLHHVFYAALVNGLGTVLAWRIVLHTLRDRMHTAWSVSLALAAPLISLGIYSILPFPSYDCDTAFSILLAILLLQRTAELSDAAAQSHPANTLAQPFIAGAALALPIFFKQNIGIPFLATALAFILCSLLATVMRRNHSIYSGWRIPCAIVGGAIAVLLSASLILHLSAGVGNYLHWTIQFAAQRRLPSFGLMIAVFAEPNLLWQLPSVVTALFLLHSRFRSEFWTRLTALALLASPFIWTLVGLAISSDSDDRAHNLLALWPLLLILAASLTLSNLIRKPSLRTLLPAILLAAIYGTFLSQQLWGSTYAIWPLLVLLIAEMLAYLASFEERITAPQAMIVTPALAAIIAATLMICGGLYTASEERLSYVQLNAGPVAHSTFPALKGISVTGPYLPEFEQLLRFSESEIPISDGVILIPGEDPFYFATGRIPQFPVLLFDKSTDPLTPAQLMAEAQERKIRWLIVKRNLQIKEDVTPQRESTLIVLQQVYLPYRKLDSYDVYRAP